MKVNPNISEEQNLLNHINEINEFPLKLSEVEFGTPRSKINLPDSLTKDQFNASEAFRNKFLKEKNTSVKVTAKDNSERWEGSSTIRSYRRVHVGAQWLIYAIYGDNSDGSFSITTDSWRYSTPKVKEVFDAIKSRANFRMDSLKVTVVKYSQNGYNYDTGKIRVTANPDSLVYIGSFDMDVIFKPISFLPITLDGFHGVKRTN